MNLFHLLGFTIELVFGLSTYVTRLNLFFVCFLDGSHIILILWVVFVKAIFSYLSIKPNDGSLPYSMPKGFNKTRHGLKDIIFI